VRAEATIQRTASALSTYLQPIHPRAIAALQGGVVYAVLPLKRGSMSDPVRIARGFVERIDSPVPLYAGVGSIVTEIAELPDSRRGADAALRVLRSRRDAASGRVADIDAVQVDALMLRVSDSLVADHVRLAGPLAVLIEYDETHRTSLTETLRMWLEEFGDVAAAAAKSHIHKNSFRYRMNRIAEIAGIDLTDPAVRFGLMLQFRAFAL